MIEGLVDRITEVPRFAAYGRATRVVGLVIEAVGMDVAMGELCRVRSLTHDTTVLAEVVGFHERGVLLMPLGEVEGIHPGSAVEPMGRSFGVEVGPGLLGRTVDGLGMPLDGLGDLGPTVRVPLSADPPNPLARCPIDEPMATGVRAIDGLLTVGRGQRIGIFSGSGVGKSTLLGSIARSSEADINVVALIGERGREVREFIERDLGEAGLARSVVVVATSDQSAILRLTGAFLATAIAEYFRDQGNQVMLMLDSVTRFCWAQREVGLAIGEPPTTRGYTPSVFARLPRLLERAGTAAQGSITGLYTVLVDGDDMNEPVADAVRSILDGHIVLDRGLAARNHYPAIDVLQSVSRLMPEVAAPEHQRAAGQARKLLATYANAEDLIQVGAYQAGSSETIDAAIRKHPGLEDFLIQRPDEPTPMEETVRRLRQIAEM